MVMELVQAAMKRLNTHAGNSSSAFLLCAVLRWLARIPQQAARDAWLSAAAPATTSNTADNDDDSSNNDDDDDDAAGADNVAEQAASVGAYHANGKRAAEDAEPDPKRSKQSQPERDSSQAQQQQRQPQQQQV